MNEAAPTREEFLSELAHELRNPLASIMSSVELMQTLGQHSEGVPRLLEIVDQKVRTMATVIDHLFVAESESTVVAGDPHENEAPTVVVATLRVLVVDDNATAADSLVQILGLHGYEAAAAYGGMEGFEKMRTFDPQAAILDIGMPDIDGYALARLIHAEDASCALIALTGYGQDRDKARASEAGFQFHLTKPAGIKDIEAILQKIAATLAQKGISHT